MRPLSPPVAFGSNSILVEATRLPEQASRFPLEAGSQTWVGVHRIHTLEHPGLSFLIVSDGSRRAEAAVGLGGQIARLAHARVTLIGCGMEGEALQAHLQEARKQLGSGLATLDVQTSMNNPALAVILAVEQQPYDLVVLGFDPKEDLSLAEQILQEGEHHLLLVPGPQTTPVNALICVTSGEPGKDDVLFAGRLVRHLGADATLLSVLPAANKDAGLLKRTENFLEGGVQSLSILGVPARTTIRSGPIADEIEQEAGQGGYDLLVLGLPLAKSSGKLTLSGIIEQLLNNISDKAILVVRSHYLGRRKLSHHAGEARCAPLRPGAPASMSAIQVTPTPSEAESGRAYRAPFPWGRLGLRTAALSYLAIMLLIPLAIIFQDGLRQGIGGFWSQVSAPIAWSALKLTLWTSAIMTAINTIMGTLTAYVLVRYEFPGKSILNSIIDIPLAIPTLVAGVMLVILLVRSERWGHG